jgi:hypothetical protein
MAKKSENQVYAKQRNAIAKAWRVREAELREGGPGSGRRPGPGSYVGISIKHNPRDFKGDYVTKFTRIQKMAADKAAVAAIRANSAKKHAALGDISKTTADRAVAKQKIASARLARVRSMRPPDFSTPAKSGKGSWRNRPARRVKTSVPAKV